MPDLTKLPVPQHQANQPYHWTYDNLPLKALADRDEVINNAVDSQAQIINAAAGNQGNFAIRLSQSLEEDGDLKSSAVDQALHSIAEHVEGSRIVSASELEYYVSTLGYSSLTNPVSFVRMLSSERDKLSLIPSNATDVALEFCEDENCESPAVFSSGKVRFLSSEFISWDLSFNTVRPVLNTSLQLAHQHLYNIEPTLVDASINKYDASGSGAFVPYMVGSLRVYINGVRLNSDYEVFYPKNPSDTSWESGNSLVKGGKNKYTADPADGSFTLLNAISEDDIIRVDFDRALS